MARGGARPGAGRKKGFLTEKSREVATKLSLTGETPLEFMLNIMRCEDAPADMRFDAAKASAQYMHPRLSSSNIDAKVQGTLTLVNEFPD